MPQHHIMYKTSSRTIRKNDCIMLKNTADCVEGKNCWRWPFWSKHVKALIKLFLSAYVCLCFGGFANWIVTIKSELLLNQGSMPRLTFTVSIGYGLDKEEILVRFRQEWASVLLQGPHSLLFNGEWRLFKAVGTWSFSLNSIYFQELKKKVWSYFFRGARNKNFKFAFFHPCQNASILDLENRALYLCNKFLQIEFNITLQAVGKSWHLQPWTRHDFLVWCFSDRVS
jgi:hypothetical protein